MIMETTKKACDYLYDIGLGLDPKTDKLIIEAIEKYHSDKTTSFLGYLKTKELAYLDYMRSNLLDDTKGDEIKYVSAQKEVINELIDKLTNETTL